MKATTKVSKRSGLIIGLVREEIINMVSQDELLMASQMLREVLEIYDVNTIDEAVVLERNIFSLEKKQRMGILDFETENKERNRLADRLLKIVDNTFQINVPISTEKQTSNWNKS